MSEVNVTHHHEQLPSTEMTERIDISNLLLVGCVDLEWGHNEYPLPVFAFKNEDIYVSTTASGKPINRIFGLRPIEEDCDNGNLISGKPEATIELPGDSRFGKGSVGNDLDGYIFEAPLPYLLDHKLAFVREADAQSVIMEEIINDKPYKLVYAPAAALEKLGQLAFH